ncbi:MULTISPECIES: DsbE family thiol:disulfide interchange protein [unclassified Roseovarius]|uniref:DsbE family thiol:disulfide interchange protein n=1 Tax=unclassified Roseovarius TaxID=2614913 RepID=UPI00273DFFDE|nr:MULTISPECIES: DsbE family thiol:disulfide interchange protein [unclassified Roseovarius]
MAKISPLMVLPPVVFLGLAALFFVGMQREDPDGLPSALVGKQAPAVALTQLGDQQPFTDGDLRDGNVKLVNYWASWCGPCRAEHPNLELLAEEGVTIYGANYKDKPENALGFLEELGDPYTAIGADDSGRMALDWGVYGVPETYVIDGDGNIVLRFAGPITERALESTIRPAIESAR